MKLCDLPISFFSNSAKVRILLTTVGVKLTSAFQLVREGCEDFISSLDLDVESLELPFVHSTGKLHFGISVCESSDALPFLLCLADPRNPHLNYHIIVGVTVGESQEDLVAYSKSFNETCSSYSPSSSPCLFVFSSNEANYELLPQCATVIPSNSSDIKRIVRQGLLGCLMNFFFMNHSAFKQINEDVNPEKFIPRSLCQAASICIMFHDFESANAVYTRGLHSKGHPHFQSASILASTNKHLHIEIDKSIFIHDLPAPLSSLKGSLSDEFCTAIALDSHSKDQISLIRTLLRIAMKVNNPQKSRILICYAISLSEKIYSDLMSITDITKPDTHFLRKQETQSLSILGILSLLHFGLERSFLFYASNFIENHNFTQRFFLVKFVDVLTSGGDWYPQRLHPASQLFSNPEISREIKSLLINYLLTYLHRIKSADGVKQLLALFPSALEVEADTLVDVTSITSKPQLAPIKKTPKDTGLNKEHATFIFSPLEKRKFEPICSVGDCLSFSVSIYNPLVVPLPLKAIYLKGDNLISTPASTLLPPKNNTVITLLATPLETGKITITGLQLITGNITAKYSSPTPIVFEVIQNLPMLSVRRPFTSKAPLYTNSDASIRLELINTSSAPVNLKGIRFGPCPPVLVHSSLPVGYPPKVDPPLPDEIKPGESQPLILKFLPDESWDSLSFAIDYGTDEHRRDFEFSSELSVEKGPSIQSLRVIPLEEHDDFTSSTFTLMIVINNPLDLPISVKRNGDEKDLMIAGKSLGTIIITAERIDCSEVPTSKRWTGCEGLPADHIRKCEQALIKDLQRDLTQEERKKLWIELYLKFKMENQIQIQWSNLKQLKGRLPLTHVVLDDATLLLMQKPPFSVDFSIEKKAEMIWEVKCTVDGKADDVGEIKEVLQFKLENTDGKPDTVFTAGQEEVSLKLPESVVTAVHCLPVGDLVVIGKFFVGKAFFIRIAKFDIKE